jgi:hypothetical protein
MAIYLISHSPITNSSERTGYAGWNVFKCRLSSMFYYHNFSLKSTPSVKICPPRSSGSCRNRKHLLKWSCMPGVVWAVEPPLLPDIGRGLCLAFTDETINKRTQHSTDDWSNPEQPKLRNCPIADKQSDTSTTCGVYRCLSDRDADQMNQGKS